MVGSMGPPGGGRNPVSNRLLRHFCFVSFAEMTDKSIARIFETILVAFTGKYLTEDATAVAGDAVRATISVYNDIKAQLLPTPAKSHYTFNLRDIAKVVQVGSVRVQAHAFPLPDRHKLGALLLLVSTAV